MTAILQRRRQLHAITLSLLLPLLTHASEALAQAPLRAVPPEWAEEGAYVFRVSTPDEADVLPQLEQGHAVVANLLDGTVPQITVVNGLIGHDHLGAWNWDGLWPNWNRVTFRAGSFDKLSSFMARAKKNSNTYTGFHLNLTDVNIGLRDYPESRAFFQKLVETDSIYRRDWNKATNRREGEPFVPQEIDKYASDKDNPDPVRIFALMNYKRFWDSGLAKQMIDEFYGNLPFAPPMLYLDVLNAKGGNFSTGAPDGPLGGSEKTQVEGMQTIADYLRSKGTDLGTEGNRRFLEKNAEGLPRAGYVWLHGSGFSEDDYSVISGGSRALACQHTWGNAGAFNVSPIASTQPGLDRVRAHYAALLAGKPGTKAVASLNTLHIAKRDNGVKDEFDIPGTGDPYRGDWADLVNNFYLTAIQENYHIGKRNVRVKTVSARGRIHVGTYRLSQSGTSELKVLIPDFVTDWTGPGAREYGFKMLEEPIETTVTASKAGAYQGRLTYRSGGGRGDLMLNVYVNGSSHKAFETLPVEGQGAMEVDLGTIQLREGENTISFDTGAIQAQWSDGTMAEWSTPYLRKGFRAWNGDVVFATDYDRMWPDTWSGQKKIYFFSWDGTDRRWRLPADWTDASRATLYPLTPEGRGKGVPVAIKDRTLSPSLLPQVPYILVPETK